MSKIIVEQENTQELKTLVRGSCEICEGITNKDMRDGKKIFYPRGVL